MNRVSQCCVVAVLLWGSAWLVSAVHAADQQGPSQFSGASPLEWSVRMADSEIARRGESLVWKEGGRAKWDYTVGLFTLSLLRLNERAPSAAYVDFPKAVIGSFIAGDGQIRGYKLEDYNLDNLAPGRTVLALYRLTQEERYQKAAALLRSQLNNHPRTSDGRFLAQAAVSPPDVAGRPLHGLPVLRRVWKAIPRARCV